MWTLFEHETRRMKQVPFPDGALSLYSQTGIVNIRVSPTDMLTRRGGYHGRREACGRACATM